MWPAVTTVGFVEEQFAAPARRELLPTVSPAKGTDGHRLHYRRSINRSAR